MGGAEFSTVQYFTLPDLFSEGTYVSIYDVSPLELDGSPSAISAHSRPPVPCSGLLASGAHSIGFRTVYGSSWFFLVVCCLCIDLT